jgi:YHS domain-containing protein
LAALDDCLDDRWLHYARGRASVRGESLDAGTQTDCSINGEVEGKTYCFGSKEAMTEFMKNPTENLAKAKAYYSSKHPG